MTRAAVVLSACLLLLGCSVGQGGGGRVPTVALALEGPSLAIVGEFSGLELEGTMDRTCMAGIGTFKLHSTEKSRPFFCEARVNAEPTEKGRVRGILDCSNGRPLVFSLRNIGPDQGVGIARSADGSGPLMVFFYHASKEEAERRFPAVRDDIAAVSSRE